MNELEADELNNNSSLNMFAENENSSTDDVYDQILLQIIRGDLVGEDPIPSAGLARELEVSRTPVVAAIERLVSDGILIKEKNRRAVVRPGAENWLVQIHELREIIEPPAAAEAAKHISSQVIVELEELAEQAHHLDGEDWLALAMKLDYSLHLSIADACGNLPLRQSIYRCWSFKRLSYRAGGSELVPEQRGYREHLTILKALKQRDSKTAATAMAFHLRSTFCNAIDRSLV